ncbi:MAG: MFS transporter [Litoreibacter sp.]|nr:MFS transporter [Litoreibacter sp.]
MVIVNTVVLVQGELGMSERWTAVLLMCFGAGSMVAALSMSQVLARLEDRPVSLSAGAIMASALGLGALNPGYVALALLWFVIGLGYSAVLVIAGRLLQRSSTKPDRPAYFAAQFALSHLCFLVTYALAGWLGSTYGLPLTFAMFSAIVLLALGAAAALWPAQDDRELLHEHPAVDHAHLHIHDEHHQHAHEGWEGPEPHSHPHRHVPIKHRHRFTIDLHHNAWPR